MAESKAVKTTTKADDETTEKAAEYGTKLTAKDGPVFVTLINGAHLGASSLKVLEMERDDEGFGVYIVTELSPAGGPRVRRIWIPYTNVMSIWQDVAPSTESE